LGLQDDDVVVEFESVKVVITEANEENTSHDDLA
jgi:hypothetical protein